MKTTFSKIQKILEDNQDGNLTEKGFRDMLAQQISNVLGPRSGRLGATVMTPEASSYNPKKDGPGGAKPSNV
jgi:hypothetical protein